MPAPPVVAMEARICQLSPPEATSCDEERNILSWLHFARLSPGPSRRPVVPQPGSVDGRSSVGGAWSWLEGCGHVTDFLDEAKGAGYAFEAVVLVEGRCSLVECIHDDDSGCDGLGRDDNPLERVSKKYPA